MRKPKELRFPNMDVFTEEDLTRNFRATRFSNVEISAVQHAVRTNDISFLGIVGASKKQMEVAKKVFKKLREEYETQLRIDNKMFLYRTLLED